MTKWIISTVLLLCVFTAKAHQSDISSTVLVENEDNSWILSVRSAMTAFEYEIKSHYGANAFDSPEVFQALVLEYLKENITISYNGSKKVELDSGYVKLGHETSVVFQLIGTPKELNSLTVTNSSFRNIYKSQSALVVLKQGFVKDQFILSNKNAYTAQLKVSGTKFLPQTTTKEQQTQQLSNVALYPLLAGLILLLIVGGLVIIRNRLESDIENKLTISFHQ